MELGEILSRDKFPLRASSAVILPEKKFKVIVQVYYASPFSVLHQDNIGIQELFLNEKGEIVFQLITIMPQNMRPDKPKGYKQRFGIDETLVEVEGQEIEKTNNELGEILGIINYNFMTTLWGDLEFNKNLTWTSFF